MENINIDHIDYYDSDKDSIDENIYQRPLGRPHGIPLDEITRWNVHNAQGTPAERALATNVSLSTVYRLDRKFMHTGDLKYHRRALSDSNLPILTEYQEAVFL
jgi:hypothetical protein